MQSGYIALLVVMSFFGLIMLSWTGYATKQKSYKTVVKAWYACLSAVFITGVAFLGTLFATMDPISEFECIDQGIAEIHQGDSTVAATWNEGSVGESSHSNSSLKNQCRAAGGPNIPCSAWTDNIDGCYCRAVRTPNTYKPGYSIYRVFKIQNTSTMEVSDVILNIPIFYPYESMDAARDAANTMNLSEGKFWLRNRTIAAGIEVQNITHFDMYYVVDKEARDAQEVIGTQGSQITGSVAAGLIGLGILYGVYQYRTWRNLPVVVQSQNTYLGYIHERQPIIDEDDGLTWKDVRNFMRL